jgi:phosphoribosylanthranilate isomerase
MIVKICGLTNLEDARQAVEFGADMLGFNFYHASPRCLDIPTCRTIVSRLRQLEAQVVLVGVFVNAGLREITHILDECSLDLAQLCGDEPPETLAALTSSAFKAIQPRDSAALESAVQRYLVHTPPPAYLIDAYQPGQFGGGGQPGDWRLAASLASRQPILLAGGLSPANVLFAIQQVHPWGVDVASGVESAPGRKDPNKMAEFIQAAKGAGAGAPTSAHQHRQDETTER